MTLPVVMIVVGIAVVLAAVALWRWRTRPPPHVTPEEKLLAARKATRAIRRKPHRRHRGTFEDGAPPSARHVGPAVENAGFGDAAGAGGGGSSY